MDTQTLIESLRSLEPNNVDWKFALYSARKSRDGVELDWNVCKIRSVIGLVEMMKSTLLEKTLTEKTVQEHSPFLSDKESLGALERKDKAIRSQVADILLNIKNGLPYSPESFVSDELHRTTGFAFYGEYEIDSEESDEPEIKQVLFMKRGNPFVTGAKMKLCISDGSEAVYCDKPVLKFTSAVDFILIDDICYFNSSAIEKDFAMENRYFAIAVNCLETIAEAEIISDFEKFEAEVMSAKNAKKFAGFDEQILEHVSQLEMPEREKFLSTYGITVNHNGEMDTSDSEQCELIVDLLCGRSVVDPLGRLAIGNNITPRG